MTVDELISVLKQYPGNTPLLVSSDEEGNEFHYLSDCSEQYVEDDDSLYDIDVYSEEDLNDGDGVPYGFRQVIVLWP